MAIAQLLHTLETVPLLGAENLNSKYMLEAAVYVCSGSNADNASYIKEIAVMRGNLQFFYPAYADSFDAILGILPKAWRLAGFTYPFDGREAICFLTREADGKHPKQGITSHALTTIQHAFLHATLQAIDWERKNA